MFAVLLPTVFLVTPLAWWIWKQNWLGSVWLTRVLAVGSALVIPALVLGVAWYVARRMGDRGGHEKPAPAAAPTAAAPAIVRNAADAPGTDMPDLEAAAS